MKYEEVRSMIQTGDILACEGNATYSWIIKKWGGVQNWFWDGKWKEDKFSHVGIAIWITFPHDQEDRLCILEAHALKGIRLNPLSEVLKNYWKSNGAIYWQAVKPSLDGDVVAEAALKNWTKAYPSLWQFLVAGLRVSQWVRKKIGLGVDTNKDKFHCSELTSRSLIEAGFVTDLEPSVTTPQMVSEFDCLAEPLELKA